ncbi:AcrR family transcriptional regulator [Microbacterium resistens]|uniref:AcrR family transcriptional regulator n=1 Tax=Microbacterium resistens TaxID=156977 RepID=A0ABU1SCU8_9MICO|nr:TetR/AcrR family transcriptional regulator [Microbacterium resistens]MDR6867436.1 AcrR family transcriptional regulator [Microbacterium resistens]
MTPSSAPARRDASRVSRDARSERTRSRLEAGLTAALQETDDPSVGLVCERARVARSTFYTHFASLDDLAESLLGEIFDTLFALDVTRRRAGALTRAEIYDIGLAALVDAVMGKREIFLWAFGETSQTTGRLLTRLTKDLRDTIRAERGDASESFLDIAGDYIAAGFVYAIARWMEGHGGRDAPEITAADRAELLSSIRELSPSWFLA